MHNLQSLLHFQPPPRSLEPILQQGLRRPLQLVQLSSRAVQILLVQMILRTREDAQGMVTRNESLAAEGERRQQMRGDMSEHASAHIRHERDARDGGCDARRGTDAARVRRSHC